MPQRCWLQADLWESPCGTDWPSAQLCLWFAITASAPGPTLYGTASLRLPSPALEPASSWQYGVWIYLWSVSKCILLMTVRKRGKLFCKRKTTNNWESSESSECQKVAMNYGEEDLKEQRERTLKYDSLCVCVCVCVGWLKVMAAEMGLRGARDWAWSLQSCKEHKRSTYIKERSESNKYSQLTRLTQCLRPWTQIHWSSPQNMLAVRLFFGSSVICVVQRWTPEVLILYFIYIYIYTYLYI